MLTTDRVGGSALCLLALFVIWESRTLPLGTWLLVENPKNGRGVRVRVNDRGPAVDGRVLDLSYAAARVLGATDAGVFRVRYRVVDAQSPGGGASSDIGERPRP